MDYSCGLGPQLGGSLKRGSYIRRSLSSKYAGGIDWHLRTQFAEQLRCLDARCEVEVAAFLELVEYYKKRGQFENEYAECLNRLTQIWSKPADLAKRQQWPAYTTTEIWGTLIDTTGFISKHHSAMGAVFHKLIVQRLMDLVEDYRRITGKGKQQLIACQERVLTNTVKLQSDEREYVERHQAATDASRVATRFEEKFEKELKKFQAKSGKGKGKEGGPEKSRSVQRAKAEFDAKNSAYQKLKLATTRARNEYLIQLEATNACIRKYFSDEVPTVLECMAVGLHDAVSRVVLTHVAGEDALRQCHSSVAELLNQRAVALSPSVDQKLFLDKYNLIFAKGPVFSFQPHKEDSVCQISSQPVVREILDSTARDLRFNLETVAASIAEVEHGLEEAGSQLLFLIDQYHCEVGDLFPSANWSPTSTGGSNGASACTPAAAPVPGFGTVPGSAGTPSALVTTSVMEIGLSNSQRLALRENRLEQETAYWERCSKHLETHYRLHQMEIKLEEIERALGRSGMGEPAPEVPRKQPRQFHLPSAAGGPKLFGGSIAEYVEATRQAIPGVILSCIRMLNMHGMHHQGIFRISGGQQEVADYKSAFERGEDPLATPLCEGKDINSTAGLLKLYFRELSDPVFSKNVFSDLISTSRDRLPLEEYVDRVREIVARQLHPAVYVVLRYVFAFLNHLSQYAEENMMDPYNLAICFGPTLMPVPRDLDPVQYQANANDVVKLMIQRSSEIFNEPIPGPTYEKYWYPGLGNTPGAGASVDGTPSQDDMEGGTEDESTPMRRMGGRLQLLSYDEGESDDRSVDDDELRSTCDSDAASNKSNSMHSFQRSSMPIMTAEGVPPGSPKAIYRRSDIPIYAQPTRLKRSILSDSVDHVGGKYGGGQQEEEEQDPQTTEESKTQVDDQASRTARIDDELTEVIQGLASLEQQQQLKQEQQCHHRIGSADRPIDLGPKSGLSLPYPTHTPDLVLDLPSNSGSSGGVGNKSQESSHPTTAAAGLTVAASTVQLASPQLPTPLSTAADTFAKQDQDTMKKRPAMQPASLNPASENACNFTSYQAINLNFGSHGAPPKPPPPVAPKPRRF